VCGIPGLGHLCLGAAVTDSTDTNTKTDLPRRPRNSAPITPIGAAAYLANLGRAADQIGGYRVSCDGCDVTVCNERPFDVG
jgi:hypothetical protein